MSMTEQGHGGTGKPAPAKPAPAKESAAPLVAPGFKRWRLMVRAHVDDAVQEPGYIYTLPIGANPGAIAEPVDEEAEHARVEMAERHKKELAEIDGTAERDELLRKHTEESAALRAQGAKKEVEERHKEEAEELAARHAAEAEGLKKNPVAIVPPESNEAQLKKRQEAEVSALKAKHAQEVAALNPEAKPAA